MKTPTEEMSLKAQALMLVDNLVELAGPLAEPTAEELRDRITALDEEGNRLADLLSDAAVQLHPLAVEPRS